MLTGDTHDRPDCRITLHRFDQRRHLDGLGPRAEDGENFHYAWHGPVERRGAAMPVQAVVWDDENLCIEPMSSCNNVALAIE